MRAYELMVIIDGDLDADQAQAQVQSIEARCNEAGTVASTDFWGRRTFAYEINPVSYTHLTLPTNREV